MMNPVAIDLYCGAGGKSLGFLEAGFRIALGVDNDLDCIETYHENLGARAYLADMFVTEPSKILEYAGVDRGDAFVLLGCPPCQGFSTLGKGRGDDKRNELVRRFAVMLEESRPLFFVFENVSGILDGWPHFAYMMRRAKSSGYVTRHTVADMRDFGVPQRRVRVVVAGCRDRTIWKRFVFPSPTHAAEPNGNGLAPWRTVRNAIAGLPCLEQGEGSDIPNHEAGTHRPAVAEKIRGIPKNGGSRRQLPKELWYPCHRNGNGFNDVLGRMAWDRPAPTITTGCCNPTKGRFLHPEQDRAITPREAARLQTFPDTFIFYGTKTSVMTQIGNAFPPLYARLLADRIMSAIVGQDSPGNK